MSRARPMREYIRKLLYASGTGYFSRQGGPILSTGGFDFSSFPDRRSYEQAVAATYQNGAHCWLTPTEKFRPYYSHAVCNRILSSDPCKDPKKRKRVYEIGGGNGTMALETLKMCKRLSVPIRYTIIDVSEALVERQSEVLHEFIKNGCCEVVCADATTWDGWDDHGHVLALEVLDNLCHDKVRVVSVYDSESGQGLRLELQQCVVTDRKKAKWIPLTDKGTAEAIKDFGLDRDLANSTSSSPLLQKLLHYFTALITPNTLADDDAQDTSTFTRVISPDIWVPTSLHRLLKQFSAAPIHSLTISDFTQFPGGLPGINAPAVQKITRGQPILYDAVEEAPPGEVDILFPTDFEKLRTVYKKIMGKTAAVVSHKEFVELFAPKMDATKCGDGYNPMVSEFQNAAVLMADP